MDDPKSKSLQDIIALMDGHMMKGYQSKLPKKQSLNLDANMSSEQSPADMAEASAEAPTEAPEMDDAAMQELMKMYESEGSDEPASVQGLY